METEKKRQRDSEAKKIKLLLKNHKGIIGKYKECVRFKEPVLFLIRVTGKVDFYENATEGIFKFKHSSREKDMWLILDPAQQLNFDYGKSTFRGYIAYEEEALPYPHKPILYSESVKILIEKALNDINNWKAKELSARGKMWFYIIGGIALIIAAWYVGKMLNPEQVVPPGTNQIIRNFTEYNVINGTAVPIK